MTLKQRILKILKEFKKKPVKVSFMGTQIKNRKLKVHKWVDDKEVKSFADQIISETEQEIREACYKLFGTEDGHYFAEEIITKLNKKQ